MAATYFPRSDAHLLKWLRNYITALPGEAKTLGVAESEIKAALTEAKELISAIEEDEAKYGAWQASVAHSADKKRQALPEIQRTIERLRSAPGHSEENDKTLWAVPTKSQPFRADEHKPTIRASVQGGKVRIHWTRGGLDGINVYSRRQGEPEWHLLSRDSTPPFDDSRPLGAGVGPGSVEVREYRVIGVVRDEEVGHASDIATVTLTS